MHSLHLYQLLRACLDMKQYIGSKQGLLREASYCANTRDVLSQACLLALRLDSLKVAGVRNPLYCNSNFGTT